MRTPLTAWSRYVKNLFGTPRAVAPLRRSRARRRHSTGGLGQTAAEVQVLEERTLLSGVAISIQGATLSESGSTSVLVPTASGGLNAPKDLTLGPDGNLYVASAGTNSVLRYNASTGQSLGAFVASGSGSLQAPFGVAFGPDGDLYVGSVPTNSILHYQGPGGASPGAFVNTLVTSGLGGLGNPAGIAFGSDGNVYVSSRLNNSILRFAGPQSANPGSPLPAAGQSGATFVAAGSGGLDTPTNLRFGPDGNLYVASQNSNAAVLRFDGSTGNFIDTFVATGTGGLSIPRGLAFDQDGRLYVADNGTSTIHRYDMLGQFVDNLVAGSTASGFVTPIGITFDSQGALLISSGGNSSIARADRGVVLTLSAASATSVSVYYATADGTATGADYTAQSGTVTFQPGQTTRRVLLATTDDLLVEPNATFTVQLGNATGATIDTAIATVTIADDDAARQMTISDTSTNEGDHTAHYRGAFVQATPGSNFNDVTFGPGNMLYTSPGPSPTRGPIDRYDAATGAFVDHFVPSGLLDGVRDIVFRDGYMYVGSSYTNEVLRYNANTGAFVDVFVTAGSGGINGTQALAFGPDTNGDNIPELFVTGRNSFSVVRYDGATGQPLGAFDTSGAGALSWPEGIDIEANGVAYVASTGSNQVQKYNATTGAYLGAVTSSNLVGPKAVRFGPSDGLVYVASSGNDRILRFNANGTYVDDFVPAASGGMHDPYRMEFGPDGDLYVSALGSNQILRFGTESEAVFTISMSTPSALPVSVSCSTASGTATAGSDFTATTGTATFAPGWTTQTLLVSTVDDAIQENDETFVVNLSNATGSVITDSQGVGTIRDNETKFLVVNDGSPDRTYDYGSSGVATGNYALNSGDTAPRGIASNAAGTTTWVVDLNKTVYVYNAAGAMLGSWTAGGLKSTAVIDGLATVGANGTDVWLLDSKNATVYRYTGAASRLSGSQNAASSFSLNSSNSNGKGIVTDGSSLWVVNDASSGGDKVFKYTLTGTLLGSWTIDAANAHPTGITIDPNNVSNIWIVDNVALKVFQYNGAATRTSGSQSAAATFALATGDSNPQDIADPPPAGLMQSIAPSLSGATGYGSPQPATGNLVNPGQTYSGFGLWSDGQFTFLGQNSDPADDVESGPLAGVGNSHRHGLSQVTHG